MNASSPPPPQRPSRWRWPALSALLVAMVFGASQLEFSCDDAFITFRYVSNAHAGHGLVWNPPPFAPVEGYTGFAWALLLWATWSWFGIEPPASANWLSLACGVMQFVVLALAALRLRRRDGTLAPDVVGLVALAVIVGNRSFLQWLTGGLETALFNLGFVAWVIVAFARERHTARWLATWSAAAALAALTRPDGLLLVAATVAASAWSAWRRRLPISTLGLGLLPLATVIAHIAWRRWFYGEWLPNTWFAKIVAAWPEAGVRYAACFVVEHGTWLVIGLALVWLAVEHRREPRFLLRAIDEHTAATAATAACLVHAGYYVFQVGGDHFEYRVFSQLVPLLVLATAAMSLRLWNTTRAPVLALLGIGLAAGAGWLHFAWTRDLPAHGFAPIATRLPAFARPLGRWFDRQQAWLLFHNIGLRCNHHAQLLDLFRRPFPGRLRIADPPDPFPMVAVNGAGIVGWCLPDCAVLDRHGLNDWVVARTPVHGSGPALTREYLRPVIDAANTDHDQWFDEAEIRTALGMLGGGDGRNQPGDYLTAILLAIHARQRPDAMTLAEADGISDQLLRARSMAHERHPPPGYVEAFAPNVVLQNGEAIAQPRAVPLTAERIRDLEREWRAKARAGTLLH